MFTALLWFLDLGCLYCPHVEADVVPRPRVILIPKSSLPILGLQLPVLVPTGEHRSCGRAMPGLGMAPRRHPGRRNLGRSGMTGLVLLFISEMHHLFWTDKEVSTLNSSGKPFSCPQAPCVHW